MTTRDSPAGDAAPGADAELARAFIDATSALVCVVDHAGRILLANRALQDFTGRSVAELTGHFFWDVYVVPEHVELAQDAIARAMATGVAFPQEGDWLAADGVRRRIAMRTDVLADAAGRPWAVACIGLDVTAERQREAQLHARAHTDLLTGLSNRSALFDVLRRHLDPRHGDGCGVLFCDLDQFKSVNDRYGHAAGDQLLLDAALRLRELAGPRDLVARLGGDEFVLVCPAGDTAGLVELAETLVMRFREPFAGPAGELVIGVSAGIAVGEPGETPDALLARADSEMYGVKSRHRRRGERPPS
ncbi:MULTISPECIES: GGDEF domain-containing protein [unclassified Modestobacter]